jgi:hypothetical protein
MNNLLTNCNNIQNGRECCHDDGRLCNCYDCLHQGFYSGADTYSCLKKLCHYIMNYGPVYVSETYHFLHRSQLLEQNFHNDINVLSLGCGFGPDFIALNKYIDDTGLAINVNYSGIDQEPGWLRITNGILPNVFYVANILDGVTLSNYNIIFLNKFFSTLLKNNNARQFLDQFVLEITNSMPIGSFIIFNDVNHYEMGRDSFDREMQNVTHVEEKYFFNIGGAYRGNYIEIQNTNNICQIPGGLPVIPINSVTKTVFFVYRKIQ